MSRDQILSLSQAALKLVIELSLPAVLAAMAVGLLISIFQSATQIQEQTLTTVPKIIVVFLVILATASWMVASLVGFMTTLFQRI